MNAVSNGQGLALCRFLMLALLCLSCSVWLPPAHAAASALSAGDSHSAALRSDGTPQVWGSSGSMQPPALLQTGLVAISSGASHMLALKSDGSVGAWGSNTHGQLVIPVEGFFGVVAVAAGGIHSLALKSDGRVIAWGDNTLGQTTVPAAALSGTTGAGHS